jgi:predicted cobalt transporter CbtA
VKLAGQSVNTGAVLSAVTVNVALQVLGASHELVTVNVTVLAPPHLLGAPELLLVTDPRSHPPDALAVASHAVNALST